MVREAHAKINLTLEILGVRPDGYQDLRSVVVPIPLHDDVARDPADAISVEMPGEIPQERNLAWRAAQALRQATGCARGVRIVLGKRIPQGAGLGGGSADAAAVLNGLNELWGLGLPKARLCGIAAAVGSDVPALTLGGPVLMEGRGERVTPLAESPLADFPLPEGRTRLYLSGVEAKEVGARASQVTFENPQARLVFFADTNDTRFDEYGVLRPIEVSGVLEAQKADQEADTEADE